MKKDPYFVNKVVKQGNSLCVRIPHSVVKELALEKGNDVAIEISKIDYSQTDKHVEGFLNTIKNIKELKSMKPVKKRMFAVLLFDMLKKSQDTTEKKEEKKRIKVLKQYEKDFGKELIEEFYKFGDAVNKAATIIEKDGSVVIKPKFR